jgi:oxygen-independent coproporphyrinogen-3 oxidase
MCEFETSWTDASTYFKEIPAVLIQLKRNGKRRTTTDGQQQSAGHGKWKAYIRNICMAFDLHLKRKAPETALFSMTI